MTKGQEVTHIGVIWPPTGSRAEAIAAFGRVFREAVQSGCLEAASGKRTDADAVGPAGATPTEILTVLGWTFGGLSLVATMPEAMRILSELIGGMSGDEPQQAIAFAVTNPQLLQPLTDFCKRCGLKIKAKVLHRADEGADDTAAPSVLKPAPSGPDAYICSKSSQVRGLIVKEVDELHEQLARARAAGDVTGVSRILDQIMRLDRKAYRLAEKCPAMIAT